MLGDINPQSVRIAQQAVVYPGRNHVNALTIKRYDGRRFEPVNLDDITRVVLAFPGTNPTIVFDSAVDAIFSWAGNTLTVDLSDYAMPASIQPSYLIVFDAEHPQGQVLVDDIDARLEFDFRLVPITGTTPPPTADFLTDAPQDGETYGRKDGTWVPLAALVSGVASVNGQTGVVVLDAASVGAATAAQGALADSAVQPSDLAAVATSGAYADLSGKPALGTAAAQDAAAFDAAGTATSAVAAHTAAADPHPQYATPAEAAAAAPVQSVNSQTGTVVLGAADVGADPSGTATSAVAAHTAAADPHPQYQTQSESDARYERGLTAGTNVSIDRTNPAAPVISAIGGVAGEVNTASNVGSGVGLFAQKVGVDLEFKGLIAGTNITITPSATGVTINAAGGGGGGAVDSVNGQTGVVVLDAADVGADAAGTATSAIAAHVSAPDPHPQYLTPAEGAAAYAPIAHVGSTDGHPVATTSLPGMMSAADKTKIDGVATGATANASTDSLPEGATNLYHTAARVRQTTLTGISFVDTALVAATDTVLQSIGKLAGRLTTAFNRANHTGEQAISTVTGLQSALDAKQATLVSNVNIKTVGGNSLLGSGNIDLSSGGATLPVVQALSSSRTLALADANTFNVNSTANAYTATIPAQASVAWAADTEIHFLRSGAGAITLTAAAGVSINGVGAASVTMGVQHGAATIKRIGLNSWWLGGLTEALPPAREMLTADRTYFVRTDGSDSNTGLANTAGGAFLTIQKAVDVAASLDLGIFNCTIQVADGAYTGAVVLKAAVGAGQVRIIGNETTPANVVISGGGNLISGTDCGRYLVAGVTVASTGVRNIQISGRSQLQYRNIVSQGAAGLNTHLAAINHAEIQSIGPITLNGNSQIGFLAVAFGFMNIRGQPITFAAEATLQARGFQGSDQGRVDILNVSFSGAFTGPRYQVVGLGAIFTNNAGETYIPGSVAGTTATGGVYY